MKNLQQGLCNTIDVLPALEALLADVSKRGLMPAEHDGFKEASLAKIPYRWLLRLPCRNGQGFVEIRARERNVLLDEVDGQLDVAVYRERTELVCFGYELQTDGLMMWTCRTERDDPRVQPLFEGASDFCWQGNAERFKPASEGVHSFIWSVIDPFLTA